jgi:pyruvate,water dikinase
MTKIVQSIGGWLRSLVGPKQPEFSPEETERLSALFRERYHSFRVLLAANERALETMAAMEQAWADTRPYGMDFVVSNATSLSVRVYRMIQHLDALAPDTYGELFERLDQIRGELDAVIQPPTPIIAAPLVLPLSAIGRDDSAVVGAKMANLGEIHNVLGLEVPAGFVITAAAYGRLLDHNDLRSEIRRLIQSVEIDRPDALFALSSQLQQLITAAEVPADVRDAVAGALAAVRAESDSKNGFAVRSSAFGEDTADTSFAGLYDSQLNIHPDNLLAAYVETAASKYTPQAMVYRRQHGLRDEDTEMAVGCMAMIDASVGGVAYTADPQDATDRRIRISAAVGLPKTVVDGRFETDLFIVDRKSGTVVDRRIAAKTTAFVLRPGEGITRQEIPGEVAGRPALTDEKAVEIAGIALRLEDHFGVAQDVEWALTSDGRVVVLQARPLHQATVTAAAGAPIAGDPLLSGGVCVSPGIAGGPVSWVHSDREALKMPEGAVLVLDYPDPRWAALLDRAAAVVAEHGGIAGHLATVAREFGVPAIFGMGSLDVLRRGEEITVDADGVAIHPGLIPGLGDGRQRRNLMAGSPVREVLGRALVHIAPLTLLDPNAPEFRPASVRTLHDITRFCHEKAVAEMFSFGSEHSFPRFAAKQLHHNVPMQWWVLNLDDGFTGEVKGKYVHLNEISCGPMHALWDGMIAVPWDGPPALSGSGLASVLFEATRNPALATPFRKPYAQRNYFMVSKNFMNLQSRFGFHFSTVETLAGDRDSENYLLFSLKGGAADIERRAARAQFIADILADKGFAMKVIEDTVTARASALPQEIVLDLVKIVGYLLMHTRQLDMIMGDQRTIDHYRSKLEGDIAGLGAG